MNLLCYVVPRLNRVSKSLLKPSLFLDIQSHSCLWNKSNIRYMTSSSQDTKCIEFVIDDDRAQESLSYWLYKSTNMKSINAEIRKAYLPFYCFNFTIYTQVGESTVATHYDDKDKLKRNLCQIYAGADYNRTYLEKIKCKLLDIQPFTSQRMNDIDEVVPWNMYRNTAWSIVQTAVEEEEKTKLNQRLLANNQKSITSPIFSYTNIQATQVYLPVYIAESKETRRPLCVFISGVTGIPSGQSFHILKYQKNTPLYRVTKTVIPAFVSLLHIIYDSLSYIYVNHIYKDMMKKEKLYQQNGDYTKIQELNRKEFAYQAKMRRRREKYPRFFSTIERWLNIDDDTYYDNIFDDIREHQDYKKHYHNANASSSTSSATSSSSSTYYQLFNIPTTATTDEIKRAFHREIKKYHPDYYKGMDAQEKSQQIINAYCTLRDENKRHQYNIEHHIDS